MLFAFCSIVSYHIILFEFAQCVDSSSEIGFVCFLGSENDNEIIQDIRKQNLYGK